MQAGRRGKSLLRGLRLGCGLLGALCACPAAAREAAAAGAAPAVVRAMRAQARDAEVQREGFGALLALANGSPAGLDLGEGAAEACREAAALWPALLGEVGEDAAAGRCLEFRSGAAFIE
ncbi:unnamed protein product, partial [Prorocentrum cordatum]